MATPKTLVVPGVYPPGGWVPYADGLFGYQCLGDGNCFWRAAGVQMYGDQEQYGTVRRQVYDHVKAHPELELDGLPLTVAVEASGYGSMEHWLASLLTDGEFGGFLEAALLSSICNYRVEIYLSLVPKDPTNVLNPKGTRCLRFHFRHSHYDALFITL